MNREDARETRDPRTAEASSRGEPLALLYQGIFTTIVRIQSGSDPKLLADPPALQRRMEGVLDEIEREAIRLGYRKQDVLDAHYAIVGFLDEAIQKSAHPNRQRWESLQAKRFERAVAGEGVYERLKQIRTNRDSQDLADLLEVYHLGFLLGYEGKYGIEGRAGLDRLMQELHEQIDRIRGVRPALSPEGALAIDEAPVPLVPASPEKKLAIVAAICAALAIVAWVALYLMIGSYAQTANTAIARESRPAYSDSDRRP